MREWTSEVGALTVQTPRVYQRVMREDPTEPLLGRFILLSVIAAGCLGCFGSPGAALGERPPLTKNVPIWEFQNKAEESGYDFNAPPKGIFHTIQFSEGFEQELVFRRGHEMVPVNPTEEFRPDTRAVFIVFKLHQHYEPFQVTGQCYAEEVAGLDPAQLVTEDAVHLALEDESGYLQFFAPEGGWKPGKYKVEIHMGWEVNAISLIGTMRFTVLS